MVETIMQRLALGSKIRFTFFFRATTVRLRRREREPALALNIHNNDILVSNKKIIINQ
jgi:hypothetical protein